MGGSLGRISFENFRAAHPYELDLGSGLRQYKKASLREHPTSSSNVETVVEKDERMKEGRIGKRAYCGRIQHLLQTRLQ